MDLIPIDCLDTKITVIGAGAIGSFVTLSLAKMGFKDITVFDDDTVSIENMSCSLYRPSDVGKPKAIALASIVDEFTKTKIEPINKKYTGGVFRGIVIAAVDSMKAREEVWLNHVDNAPHTLAIIDPRMGAETALMYVVNPMNKAESASYGSTLYADSNAVQEPCTAKATIYTANLLSGFVVKAAKNVAKGEPYPKVGMWSINKNQLVVWSSTND
jgi:molybdopterin/thiamine biosynthesis adenylyltransferase